MAKNKIKAKRITRAEFKDLIEKVLCGEPVYISGSGIKVLVTRYSKGSPWLTRSERSTTTIEFLDTPNKKSIDKCRTYDISVEKSTNHTTGQKQVKVQVEAKIDINELRAVPFKSAAASVLFGSDKETKNGKV